MPDTYIQGTPGIYGPTGPTSAPGNRTATQFKVFSNSKFVLSDASQGRLIDGLNSRDPLNSNPTALRPGLLMGKISASGFYAPSVLGVSTVNYTSGQTTLTVSTATALELVRRIGSSGTFKITGPPSANGTVAQNTVTYSAVNTATGVITVTNIGVNYLLGSLIQPTDGSDAILTFLPDGYGINVTDVDHATSQTVPFPQIPISGQLLASNLLNCPTDTTNLATLRTYILSALNGAVGGQFIFEDARY